MSFLTKYLEYTLPTENLLAWYEFNNVADSGPNSNDFSFIVQQSPFFDSGKARFDNDYVETSLSSDSYTLFFDLERIENKELIIFSQRSSSHLYFGCTKNGNFFLKLISGSKQFVRFFHSLKIPRRAIIVVSREKNHFSLTYYCPITKKTRTQGVFFPTELSINSSSIKLGVHPNYSSPLDFSSSKFILYQFSMIDVGAPSFVLTDLCEEFYIGNELEKNDFIFDGIALKDKNVDFEVDAANNRGDENGILLTYSNFLEGFTFKDFSLTGYHRFFRNGVREYPTEYSTHVVFVGQSSTDIVILDNFSNDVTTENPSIIHSCLHNSVDLRIREKTAASNLKWISSANFPSNLYSFNVNNWAYEVDLTSFAHIYPHNTYGGVLITPQHILCKSSYTPLSGQTVRFFDRGFNSYDRVVINNEFVSGSSFRVCLLDEPLPEVFSTVKFLPDSWASSLPTISTARLPLLIVNYEYNLVVKDLETLSGASSFTFTNPIDSTRLLFDYTIGSSDIGKPIFMIFNNQLICLGFYASASTTGDTAHTHKTAINNAILACGGEEYEIKEANLSRIPLRNNAIGPFAPNGAMFFKNNKRVFPTHIYLTNRDTSFDKNIIFKDEYGETTIDFEIPAEVDQIRYDAELLTFNEEQIVL